MTKSFRMCLLTLATYMVSVHATVAIAHAQSHNVANPFVDHADSGEVIHVLPTPASSHSPWDTQATDAPVANGTAVYPASYGSGQLQYHGGRIMPSPSYYAVYWNASVAMAVQDQIQAFVTNFPDNHNWDNSPTDDYEVIQQYGGSNGFPANTLTFLGTFVDSKPAQSTIKDTAIRNYLSSLFANRGLTASADTLYGIYFPSGMKIVLSGGTSCSSFCGYHSRYAYNGIQIKYAVFPYPDCSGCSLSGKSVADMLTIVSSHEIREAVSDPGDNGVNAWYDAAGYEADDKCAWHNLYQMTNGGFWVQPEYSNGGTVGSVTYPGPGCIVPNR